MLRRNMPEAEVILWSQIKGKNIKGYKFRRQYSIDKYIVDFYSPELNLAIELDGDYHLADDTKKYDEGRQKAIESLGICVLRFSNNDIKNNLSRVLRVISNFKNQK